MVSTYHWNGSLSSLHITMMRSMLRHYRGAKESESYGGTVKVQRCGGENEEILYLKRS